jgi:hypothetical protein
MQRRKPVPPKSKIGSNGAANAAPTIALVPQPHGGALRRGSLPGNTPGTGRLRDEVRENLVGLAQGKGFDFLNRLLDGEITCRLVGVCEECGHQGQPQSDTELRGVLDAIGASVDQRLKALELVHRYGLGIKDEIDIRDHPAILAIAAAVKHVLYARFSAQVAAEIESEVAAVLAKSA